MGNVRSYVPKKKASREDGTLLPLKATSVQPVGRLGNLRARWFRFCVTEAWDDVVVDCDEAHRNVKLEKIPALRPAFDREGTVTANTSTLNDGASALILASRRPKKHGLKPLARILAQPTPNT